MKFKDIKTVAGYEDLERVLCAAYLQAAVGKGDERHANENTFNEQPMQRVSQSYNTVDGMMFQVSKKLGESRGLPHAQATEEVLGAIVYSAGVHIAYDTWFKASLVNAGADSAFETNGLRQTETFNVVRYPWERDDKVLVNIDALSDDWIRWDGGECPVSADTLVAVFLRNGTSEYGLSDQYKWSHFNSWYDIMSYQIVDKNHGKNL
jgi:hypothetical protein